MNSSSYTERLRNETLYMWRLQNRTYPEQKGSSSSTVIAERMSGGVSLFRAGILPESPLPSGSVFTCKEICILTITSLLQHIAQTNPGPTRTSRLLYLLAATQAMLFSYVSTTKSRIQGVKDGWD